MARLFVASHGFIPYVFSQIVVFIRLRRIGSITIYTHQDLF